MGEDQDKDEERRTKNEDDFRVESTVDFYCEICKRQIKDLTLELPATRRQIERNEWDTAEGDEELRQCQMALSSIISRGRQLLILPSHLQRQTLSFSFFKHILLLLLLGRFNGWPAYVIIESLKCVAAAAASQAQEEQHTLECCNP